MWSWMRKRMWKQQEWVRKCLWKFMWNWMRKGLRKYQQCRMHCWGRMLLWKQMRRRNWACLSWDSRSARRRLLPWTPWSQHLPSLRANREVLAREWRAAWADQKSWRVGKYPRYSQMDWCQRPQAPDWVLGWLTEKKLQKLQIRGSGWLRPRDPPGDRPKRPRWGNPQEEGRQRNRRDRPERLRWAHPLPLMAQLISLPHIHNTFWINYWGNSTLSW